MYITIDYIAGLFDGEGSVSLTSKTRNGLTNYYGVLSLSNTHEYVIRGVQETLGGSIHIDKKRSGKNYLIYYWHASHKTAYNASKILMPYSIIKKEELKAIVSFIDRNQLDGFRARTCARWGKTEEYITLKDKISKDAKHHIQLIIDARESCRVRV